MEPQSARKKAEMFSAVNNLDKYDITDCLDILKYLHTFNRQDLQTEGFKKFKAKLESRLHRLLAK